MEIQEGRLSIVFDWPSGAIIVLIDGAFFNNHHLKKNTKIESSVVIECLGGNQIDGRLWGEA